jgi:hypothetical protein
MGVGELSNPYDLSDVIFTQLAHSLQDDLGVDPYFLADTDK